LWSSYPHRYSRLAGPLALDLVMMMGFIVVAIVAATDGGGGGSQFQLEIGPRRAAARVLICASSCLHALDTHARKPVGMWKGATTVEDDASMVAGSRAAPPSVEGSEAATGHGVAGCRRDTRHLTRRPTLSLSLPKSRFFAKRRKWSTRWESNLLQL
jgi:hypothetical protein